MKSRIIKRLVCALLAAVIMIACAMPAFAWDMDRGYAELQLNNAPEGTKYIDILVPISRARFYYNGTHDIKLTFIKRLDTKNNYKKETIEKTISKDSEIATYIDKDGFVSLTAHTDLVKGVVSYGIFHDEKEFNDAQDTYGYELCFSGSDFYYKSLSKSERFAHNYKSWEIKDVRNTFKEFKAAYIDENGKVLGVTGEFEVKKDQDSQHAFIADGDKLTLVINSHDEWFMWQLIIHLVLPAIAILAVIVIFLKWIIQGIKSSK